MAFDASRPPMPEQAPAFPRRMVDRAVLDGILAPFVVLEPVRDADGAIVDFVYTEANQAACDYNAVAYEDLVGARLLDLLPGHAASGLFDQYVSVVETGEPLVLTDFSYGNELVHDVRRYDVHAIKVGTGLSYSWLDVTDRYVTAAELALSEQRYRLLAENAADVVYMMDPEGVVTWIAPTISRALGWDPEELLGTVIARLMHPDDLAETMRVRTALHRGEDPRDSEDFLIRMLTKSGEYVWAAGTGRTVRRPDGSPEGVLVSGRVVQDLVEARQEAEKGRNLLQAVMDAMADAHVLLAPVRDEAGSVVDFEFVSANAAALESIARSGDTDVIGRRISELTPESLFQMTFEPYRTVLESGEPLFLDDVSSGLTREDGAVVRLDVRTQRVGDLLSNSWRDVTDRHEAARALAESEARYRLLAENASDVVWQIDEDARIDWVSESITRVLGWRPEQVLGTLSTDLGHPDDQATMVARREALFSTGVTTGEFRFRCADGSYLWMSLVARAVDSPEGRKRIVGLRDISREIAAREGLTFLAFHDELTGLRNRSWILDMLESDLQTAQRAGTQVGVMFIDLDNFKVVNDSLGHAAGDGVLHELASRISASIRPGDRVGRFGGDEFVVIATDITDAMDVEVIAERISHAISVPLTVEDHVIVPTVSIGIALSEADSTPASLLRDTDAALFRAKDAGRSRWQFFDQAMHTDALTRLTTEAEIRQALERRQFTVYYQPIVDLATGQVTGHEALVRWVHPDKGLLAPDAFLPVAEDSGLVVDLGEQVLDEVCRMLVANSDVCRVSVNVSPIALTRPTWTERFLGIVRDHGVDPQRLSIEITETAALSILDSPHVDLRSLRDLGIGVHVDDFGTGYSSLTLLRELPVTALKLDLTFTQTIQTDGTARVLAAGLAMLAAGLRLSSIAEGIETVEQAQIIRSQGWTHGQGYLFGRPTPEPTLESVGWSPTQP